LSNSLRSFEFIGDSSVPGAILPVSAARVKVAADVALGMVEGRGTIALY
jgi:hypothetical protein